MLEAAAPPFWFISWGSSSSVGLTWLSPPRGLCLHEPPPSSSVASLSEVCARPYLDNGIRYGNKLWCRCNRTHTTATSHPPLIVAVALKGRVTASWVYPVSQREVLCRRVKRSHVICEQVSYFQFTKWKCFGEEPGKLFVQERLIVS